MLVNIEDQTVEIDDKLVEKYNQCMQKCKKQKSKTIFISNPSCRSKFYDIFKSYKKAKNDSKTI